MTQINAPTTVRFMATGVDMDRIAIDAWDIATAAFGHAPRDVAYQAARPSVVVMTGTGRTRVSQWECEVTACA